MDLLGSLVEVGDGLIDCKLNTELATVLMDFSFYLVVSAFTLQLVGFGERRLLIPDLHSKDVRRLLVNGGHDDGPDAWYSILAVRRCSMLDSTVGGRFIASLGKVALLFAF